MRFERIIVVLIVVVLAAAAFVWLGRSGDEAVAPGGASAEQAPASLVVIGVEGFEPRVAERLIGDGGLPHLAALMERGAFATFENLGKETDHRVSWTTVATGMAPEGHGLGVVVEGRRGARTPVEPVPSNRTAETIWTLAEGAGVTPAVVGWPGTWPVEDVDGLMVGPHEQYYLERMHGGDHGQGIHPDGELDAVDPLIRTPEDVRRKDLGRFIDLDTRLGFEALVGQNYGSLAKAFVSDRSMVDVALYGAAAFDADVVCVYLGGLNIVSQRFWHYMDTTAFDNLEADADDRAFYEGQIETLGGTIDRYYGFVDELVGELEQIAGDDATIAVVSDHGYEGIVLDARGWPKIGHHMFSDEGCWIVAGPRVRSGQRIRSGSITDFAPSVLAAAGMGGAPDFDGTAREEMLR